MRAWKLRTGDGQTLFVTKLGREAEVQVVGTEALDGKRPARPGSSASPESRTGWEKGGCSGSSGARRPISKHLVFALDGFSLRHHNVGGLSANMRLSGQPAAIMVPGFACQFAGQIAKLFDGSHECLPGLGWGRWGSDDRMPSSSIHHRASGVARAPRPRRAAGGPAGRSPHPGRPTSPKDHARTDVSRREIDQVQLGLHDLPFSP